MTQDSTERQAAKLIAGLELAWAVLLVIIALGATLGWVTMAVIAAYCEFRGRVPEAEHGWLIAILLFLIANARDWKKQ